MSSKDLLSVRFSKTYGGWWKQRLTLKFLILKLFNLFGLYIYMFVFQSGESYSFFQPERHRSCKEDGVSEVFAKYGMTYNVKISTSKIGDIPDFPWLKPSDFLKHMAFTKQTHRLLGGKSVEEAKPLLTLFWSRYKKVFPRHALFSDTKASCLDKCIPILVHGDEGTTYKKKGVLIVGFQSPIGFGTRHSPNEHPTSEVSEAGIPLNFLKTALQTRFLSIICPKDINVKEIVFKAFAKI